MMRERVGMGGEGRKQKHMGKMLFLGQCIFEKYHEKAVRRHIK